MARLLIAPLALTLFGTEARLHPEPLFAWPHRAILTSFNGRPVAFRAYTLGGTLIIAVDRSGNLTTTPAAVPTVRPLTEKDTIRAETPTNFPLDLSQGPVVFDAVGGDSLRLVVGRNPNGGLDQVSAVGRHFRVQLVADKFVIDSR